MSTVPTDIHSSIKPYEPMYQDESMGESQSVQDIFEREMDALVKRFENLHISKPGDPVDRSAPPLKRRIFRQTPPNLKVPPLQLSPNPSLYSTDFRL